MRVSHDHECATPMKKPTFGIIIRWWDRRNPFLEKPFPWIYAGWGKYSRKSLTRISWATGWTKRLLSLRFLHLLSLITEVWSQLNVEKNIFYMVILENCFSKKSKKLRAEGNNFSVMSSVRIEYISSNT